MVNPATTIAIRTAEQSDAFETSTQDAWSVTGSISGEHGGETVLSDDNRTVVFRPHEPFSPGETVTARPGNLLLTEDGEEFRGFSFGIASQGDMRVIEGAPPEHELPGSFIPDIPASLSTTRVQNDSLPPGFPTIKTEVRGETAEGYLFVSNMAFGNTANTPHLLMLDNDGVPVFYRTMSRNCQDFKIQPNGLVTYFDRAGVAFYAMDTTFAIVDSFRCGNGYTTDQHELRLLDNGHALLMSYNVRKIDMSRIVEGGNPDASVWGLIIQELDRQKNVVFEWRSWDHFEITDATMEDLTAALVDYVHGNAIEVDTDGNLLISSRHMDEITKIDRETGEIIWRLGGKNNQFTFVNDPEGFSHQHAVRRIANGNITLYDNGVAHTPQYSRAVEYRIDERLKTAELVWQFRHDPDVFGQAMGYVQRLGNGNTLISWGSTTPALTEVRPDGTVVFELMFADGIYTYRGYRFPWKSQSSGAAPPIPVSSALLQNYPNPFNATTIIPVHLARESSVNLTLYDLRGRKVMTLLNEARRDAGIYYVSVDGSMLASGVYYYQLRLDSGSHSRRMVLIK